MDKRISDVLDRLEISTERESNHQLSVIKTRYK